MSEIVVNAIIHECGETLGGEDFQFKANDLSFKLAIIISL
jgi:hypothetical protein